MRSWSRDGVGRRGGVGAVASLLVAVLLAVPAAATTAGVPDGALGIRLDRVPAEADPREQAYVVDSVVPGARVERDVVLLNGTAEPLRVALDAAVAQAGDGWVVRDDLEPGPDDLAAWTSVEPAVVEVPARGEARATVTIVVPGDAPGGEQYAVVLATPPTTDAGGGVGVVNRVGMRIYLAVAADGVEVAPADFTIDTLAAGRDEDGGPYVQVGVTSTGGRAIDVAGELQLRARDGSLQAGPFGVAVGRTLGPGASGTVLVPVDPTLPVGPWEAEVVLRSGALERAASATLRFPADSGQLDAPTVALPLLRERDTASVVASGLLVTAAVLLVLVLMRVRRRRDAEPEDAPDGPPTHADPAEVDGVR